MKRIFREILLKEGESMGKLETDVVIVAGGVAGLSAAISAAQGGAGVIVFEKTSTTGGTGNMGMGPLGIES